MCKAAPADGILREKMFMFTPTLKAVREGAYLNLLVDMLYLNRPFVVRGCDFAACSPAEFATMMEAAEEKQQQEGHGAGFKLENTHVQAPKAGTVLTSDHPIKKMVGCSQPVLSQYERGDRDPHGDEIVAAIRRRTGISW